MSDVGGTRSDRVVIDESVIGVYKELTDGTRIEQAPFKTMKDVFMLAVTLGYRKGTRRAAPSSSKYTIRKDVFSESDLYLLKAIAIAETGGVDVLLREGDVLALAEEFAQAGIQDVKAQVLEQGGQPLWNMISFIS